MRLLLFLFAFLVASLLFVSARANKDDDDVDGDVDVSDEDLNPSASHSDDGDDADIDVETDDDAHLQPQRSYTLETLPGSDDITTTVYFPPLSSAPGATPPPLSATGIRQFIVGDEVSMLIGIANTGSRQYNLTYISGALHSPFDHTYYIQNFTVQMINAVIDPNTEMSIEYRFKTDANLEPQLEFQLQTYFLYNTTDDREIYRTTFFNSTVELVDRNSDFNTRTLFSSVLLLSSLVGGGYWLYSSSRFSRASRRSKRTAKPPVEWNVPAYTPAKESKPVKKRSHKN